MDGSPPGSAVPGILQARTLEWVAISFSNAWKWKVKVKSLSRVRLLATPWTAAHQAPPSMGVSRQDYWSGCHRLLWCNHYHHLILERFIALKGNPVAILSVTPHPSPNPTTWGPRQPAIYFLSLQTCLFWTSHVSGSHNMWSSICGVSSLSIMFSRDIRFAV